MQCRKDEQLRKKHPTVVLCSVKETINKSRETALITFDIENCVRLKGPNSRAKLFMVHLGHMPHALEQSTELPGSYSH